MARPLPPWIERLIQLGVSISVAVCGFLVWSHTTGAAAGLETGRVIAIERRLDEHFSDDDIHFTRTDAERLVRIEETVKSIMETLGRLGRK